MKKIIFLIALAACGDNKTTVTPDATTTPDVPPDNGTSFVVPTPFAVPLASAGPDQLMSVAAAPGGGFYAAGFAAQTVTGVKYVVVVKLTAAGTPDTTFATNGVYTSTLEFKGGTD